MDDFFRFLDQVPDYTQLLATVGNRLVLPGHHHNWQMIVAPISIYFVVVGGLTQLQHMTSAPCDPVIATQEMTNRLQATAEIHCHHFAYLILFVSPLSHHC